VRAGVVHEMVLHRGLATAVIAQDVLCAACVLGGEPLRGYQRVEHLKVHAHVAHGLGADWASVVVAGVCLRHNTAASSRYGFTIWGARMDVG
jgi:hypothetical protein